MNLNQAYNMLFTLQCNFNKDICDKIFESNSDHLYEKWLQSDENILNFIARLDKINKQKLFNWMML